MNLLFVIPEYPPHSGGGIITFYKNLLPELVRQGHRVHAVVGSAFTSLLPPYEDEGVTVEFLDHAKVDSNLSLFGRFSAVPELQRHLSAAWTAFEQADHGAGFDVVETTDWGLLFVPWVVQLDTPPVVVQLHGSVGQIDYHDPKAGNELLGILARLIESDVLALSDALQSYSRNNATFWSQATGNTTEYIPPAWISSLANQDYERENRGLVVARIQLWKGPIVLCEALRLLGDFAPDMEWAGRDFDYMGSSMSEYLAAQYPDVWQTKIKTIGPQAALKIAELQSRADFVIVPSTWDVFNFTCIEAMGHGQIVICSDQAGASSLIQDGVNGLTFAGNNSASLAHTLERFLNLTDLEKTEMRAAAKQTVISELSPPRVAAERLKRYRDMPKNGKSVEGISEWLIDSVSPNSKSPNGSAFLDRLPLKELTRHVSQRALRKLYR
jgi:glycosyltransferase involved in cell wall biosynthesis